MASRRLLSLPHEIRHLIYQAYFTLDGGYAFQPGSGKLAAADGQPLDLALMYTCQLIASETKNLPLKHNVVSFSTVYHPEWRSWAGRFDYLLRTQYFMQTHILVELGSLGYVTPAIYEEIGREFPWFVPKLQQAVRSPEQFRTVYSGRYLDEVARGREWKVYRTVTSRERVFWGTSGPRYELSQAVKFALRLVAQKLETCPGSRSAQSIVGWQGDRKDLLDFLDECFEPWDIPSWSDLEAMGQRLGDEEKWDRLQLWEVDRWGRFTVAHRSKYRFSAAAVAIRFLRHLPLSKRLSLRAIILREDHIAVGLQERHSNGFIPFLQENPRLRIEHRVSMLTNILQAANIFDDAYLYKMQADESDERDKNFLGNHVFRELSHWSVKALATLDAVKALAVLTNESSILRCNFNPGQVWSADKFIKDFQGHDGATKRGRSELYQKYNTRENFGYAPPIPLSRWEDLMMDNCESREILTHRDRREAGIAAQDLPPDYGNVELNRRARSQFLNSR
ncbi:uncharacterized protein FSUBG_807 [Fusarium subglutinans]|uniref:Uncharacterized protein n=1 Tax=Gibberella subglutinans TaxID=42677 RepID=A0A8H5QGE8_GIBSU|nr:uncharacterized protein FSUBG_807 [Fusarium subglutinans]KAF5613598.1 hypothetical protein FSUBG_807 [Fusarium subglutinans]